MGAPLLPRPVDVSGEVVDDALRKIDVRVRPFLTAEEKVLVVSADGSIRADQLARLGLRPGVRLRIVAATEPGATALSLAGSLPDLPDIRWSDFKRATELARRDLTDSP